MTRQHQITPQELVEIPMGYEDDTPVTFSEFVVTFTDGGLSLSRILTDENGILDKDIDMAAAGVFLRALEKAGYVIVKKGVP